MLIAERAHVWRQVQKGRLVAGGGEGGLLGWVVVDLVLILFGRGMYGVVVQERLGLGLGLRL